MLPLGVNLTISSRALYGVRYGKLTDLKPLLGEALEDELPESRYSHWAYSDTDVLLGIRLRVALEQGSSVQVQPLYCRTSWLAPSLSGHFTILRNTASVRRLWRKAARQPGGRAPNFGHQVHPEYVDGMRRRFDEGVTLMQRDGYSDRLAWPGPTFFDELIFGLAVHARGALPAGSIVHHTPYANTTVIAGVRRRTTLSFCDNEWWPPFTYYACGRLCRTRDPCDIVDLSEGMCQRPEGPPCPLEAAVVHVRAKISADGRLRERCSRPNMPLTRQLNPARSVWPLVTQGAARRGGSPLDDVMVAQRQYCCRRSPTSNACLSSRGASQTPAPR
eukprot:2654618-Prymnesium_polylepis.1